MDVAVEMPELWPVVKRIRVGARRSGSYPRNGLLVIYFRIVGNPVAARSGLLNHQPVIGV